MIPQSFPGFTHFTTHHCVTGSMRHIYEFNGLPISEEMLLGLGAGIGFVYWHTKGSPPFLGGRANVGRPGEEGLEKAAGRCTGVFVEVFRTESAIKAEKSLLDWLAKGVPVMLVLDMGYLPYFDFGGQEYHFGYHVVVACGYDPDTDLVLIADRDEELHPVPLKTLALARGSRYQPFPPHHGWYTFDFSGKHPPEPDEIRQATQHCAKGMLEPPISNLGIKGIRKAAQRIKEWPSVLNEKELRDACINTAIMIDARGGTGGGLFRYMYGRYLDEVAALTGQAEFFEVGKQLQTIGDRWQEVADIFNQAYESNRPLQHIEQICTLLPEIASMEETAWEELLLAKRSQVGSP